MPGGDEYDNYDRWFQAEKPGKNPLATGMTWNDWKGKPYVYGERYHPTEWTGRNAVEFINAYDKPQPFFLKVSFHRPHSPYDPPARLFNATINQTYPAQFESDWDEIYKGPSHECGPQFQQAWCGLMPSDQNAITRRAYHASITFVDEWIGNVLTALQQKNIYNNTFVLFTSDHGDMQGDHHLWRKGFAYESSSHVPMVLRWPLSWSSHVKISRGSRVNVITEMRDLFPTFLAIANQSVAHPIDGKSLTCLLMDSSGVSCGWREFIDMEQDLIYNRTIHWNALTDGDMKYIFNAYDASEQLFNVTADPEELKQLSALPEYQAILLKWRQRLIDQFVRENRGPKWIVDGKLQIRVNSILYSPNYPGDMSHKLHWDDEHY